MEYEMNFEGHEIGFLIIILIEWKFIEIFLGKPGNLLEYSFYKYIKGFRTNWALEMKWALE